MVMPETVSVTPAENKPVINVPPVITGLLTVMVGVHVWRMLLPPMEQVIAALIYGVVALEIVDHPLPQILTYFTYMAVHGDGLHLAVNGLGLAAIGSAVERLFGSLRTLMVFLVSGVVAAMGHVLIFADSADILVGASGGLSGLFGYLLARTGASPDTTPRQRLTSLLGKAILFCGLMAASGMVGMGPMHAYQIAWLAHIGGFLCGMVLGGFGARAFPI